MRILRLYISKIKYIRINDFIHFFLFIFALPCALLYKIIRRKIWLISENPDTARDNSYWLFKYINENHQNIDIVYAIKYKCCDYHRVSTLGKTVNHGTFMHWIYYLAAEKIIITHLHDAPNRFITAILEALGLLKTKHYFLQHGITINNYDNLKYFITKFSLFVCGAKPEYEFIKNNFGYPKDIVKYLGFCRFDNLYEVKKRSKQILVMPTWRQWLVFTKENDKSNNEIAFNRTEYFIKWNEFLNDDRLSKILEYNDLTLVFYPHKQMEKYVHYFKTKCNRISIANWKEWDIIDLIKHSVYLITDYSSVSMDFAYMHKSLMYYQFDYQKFREGHLSEGYFSYQNDGFGPVCYNLNDLLLILNKALSNRFAVEQKYMEQIDSFFELHDTDNCKRNYGAILNS